METDIDDILEQNERNLYAIQKTKIQQLEKKVLSQEHAFKDLNLKYKDLEDDFNHNMLAIQQRDQDLEETTEKLLQLKSIFDTTQQKQKQVELQGQLQRQNLQLELEDVLERFESNRQEQRYSKKRYEDQIKDLKYILSQKEEQIERIMEEQKLSFQNLQHDIEKTQADSIMQMSTRIIELEKSLNEQMANKSQYEEQKDQALKDLKRQYQLATQEHQKEKDINLESISAFKHEISHQKQKLQTQQITLDQLKSDIQNVTDLKQAIEVKLNEKLSQVTEERDQLFNKLQQTQLDKKQKLNYTKENCDRKLQEVTRECQEKINKNDYEKQLVTIDYEKLCVQERHLQERILELEGRLRREQADSEQRFQLHQRNQDQNRRQTQNEVEMKEFQFKQVREENERLQAQMKEFNKATDDLQNKILELSSENKILISEVVKYRRAQDSLPKSTEQFESKHDKKGKQKTSPKSKTKFLIQEDEVESFDQWFSDDQGPAPQLQISQKFSQYKSKLVASHSRVRELDNQVTQLKTIIEDITQDYDKAKNKLIINNQEINIMKNDNLDLQRKNYNLLTEKTQLESQIQRTLNLANQSDKQQLNEREVCIELLNKKIQQLLQIIQDLRAEREALLEITNDLNQKVRDNEDDSEKYKQHLLALTQDVDYLNKTIQQTQIEKPQKEQPTRSFVEQQKDQIKVIKDKYKHQLTLSEITQVVLQKPEGRNQQ